MARKLPKAKRNGRRCACGRDLYYVNKSGECRECYLDARQRSRECPNCRGHKSIESTYCLKCSNRLRWGNAPDPDHSPLVAGFDAKAFDRLLKRDDVTWSLRELERRSGVSAIAIRCWRRGKHRPNKVEWQRVAAVLALEPCDHCGGSGMVDPSGPERITALVTRQPQAAPPSLRIVRPEPKSTADPIHLACGLRFEPDVLRLVGRGVVVRLTPAEAAIMAEYVRSAGALVNKAGIAARMGSERPAVSVHSSRIYAKLRDVGIDPSEVWDGYGENSNRGMRLLLADAPAVEGVG
jgi:hypothetical protein